MQNLKLPLKIIVSGWPGAGSSTIAIILAGLLNYKYFYVGMVFRKLAEKLGYDDEGKLFAEFGEEKGKEYDKKIDKLVAKYFEENSNIILDSKIHGFLPYSNKAYEVFLKSSFEVRSKRISDQGRLDGAGVLKEREKADKKRYIDEYGFDLFDENTISKNYDCVLETSALGIADTLKEIFQNLKNDYNIIQFEKIEKDYFEKGKQFFLDNLKEKDLLVDVGLIVNKL